jgi:hypothetical protein
MRLIEWKMPPEFQSLIYAGTGCLCLCRKGKKKVNIRALKGKGGTASKSTCASKRHKAHITFWHPHTDRRETAHGRTRTGRKPIWDWPPISQRIYTAKYIPVPQVDSWVDGTPTNRFDRHRTGPKTRQDPQKRAQRVKVSASGAMQSRGRLTLKQQTTKAGI